MSQPICQHCAAGVQLFKWCPNLSARTVLQGAAVNAVMKPICRHCAAVVQLFKECQNLSAGTVLQGCDCLSGAETYLPSLCCMGAAV